MTLWIILGSLIAVVVIFLIVTSVLDRRKTKKLKLKKADKERKKINASFYISIWIEMVVSKNQDLIDNFTPSVGKYKMNEIKVLARKALSNFESSSNFKLINKEDNYKELVKNFNELKRNNSTVWKTKNKKQIDFFKKNVANINLDTHKKYIASAEKTLEKIYEKN